MRAAGCGAHVAGGLAGAELWQRQSRHFADDAARTVGSGGDSRRDDRAAVSVFQDSGGVMKELLPGLGILFISLMLASLVIPSVLLDRDDRREAKRKAR